MPGGDRTGPAGAGPQTGRGMGICAGFSSPGYMNPAPGRGRMMRGGRGMGRGYGGNRGGFGRGFGMRWWNVPYAEPYAPVNPETEVGYLKNEAQNLQEELKLIQQRIEQLDSAGNKKGE